MTSRMEEEAPSRHSVAELAGRFKGSAPVHDAAGHESEKPVRRRPPRSLNLPKPQGDDQEQPPGVTSPIKPKRNSALIEKLQANLALSPSGLLPSPKSPGFRLLPPAFPPPSAGSAPVSTVTSSSTPTPTSPVVASLLTEEEGPTSFETPPTVAEGSILSNDSIKGRARHSIRRRPPSRRHRKSSSGDEVSVANEGEGEDKTAGEGVGEAQTDKVKEDRTDPSTCPEKSTSQEEEISVKPKEEDEKKKEEDNSSMGGEKGDRSSSGRKDEDEKKEEEEKGSTKGVEGDTSSSMRKEEEEKKEEEEEMVSTGGDKGDESSSERKEEEEKEEKNSEEKQEDLTEGATKTDGKETEKIEEMSQCSVR